MYRCHNAFLLVVQKDGDAIGRRNANANARNVGHDGIDAFQFFLPFRRGELKKWGIDACHFSPMHLMWHQQAIVVDAQQQAQRLMVMGNGIFIVATEAVDVEFSVLPRAIAAVPRCAEGHHLCIQLVESENWCFH